jgi:hypothetical protein
MYVSVKMCLDTFILANSVTMPKDTHSKEAHEPFLTRHRFYPVTYQT